MTRCAWRVAHLGLGRVGDGERKGAEGGIQYGKAPQRAHANPDPLAVGEEPKGLQRHTAARQRPQVTRTAPW